MCKIEHVFLALSASVQADSDIRESQRRAASSEVVIPGATRRSVGAKPQSQPYFMGFTTGESVHASNCHEALRILGQRYNALQQQFGDLTQSDWSQEIENLFSENFSKTANDQVLVAKRADLQPQILALRGAGVGGWTIKVRDVIPSVDGYSCTLDYVLHTDNAGSFHVIAILSSDDGMHIDAVREVYYQMSK